MEILDLGPPATASPAPGYEAPATSGSPSNPTVSIAPGSWSMEAGGSAEFTATLTGFDAGCTPVSATYLWSLPGIAEFEGFLNASLGPSVRFTSLPTSSGAFSIAASARGTMECGSTLYALSSAGSAGLGVLPQEQVGGLNLYPDPATPGERVVLQWTVADGIPPYTANIDFGDGTSSTLTVLSAGDPFAAHHYAAGQFDPIVRVTDASGRQVATSSVEPLVVTAGMAAAIVTPAAAVDAGLPFSLSANVSGGVPPFFYSWTDSFGDFALQPVWNMTVPALGNFSVRLTVTDAVGDSETLGRTIAVELPPQLSLNATSPAVDVGQAFPFTLAVNGGVSPFSVAWSILPNGSTHTVTIPAFGGVIEPAVATSTGEVWVTTRLIDAAGAVRSAAFPLTEAFPAPRVTVVSAPRAAEASVPVDLGALVDGGAPPLRWAWSTSGTSTNLTPPTGSLTGPGDVRWRGTFAPGAAVEWLLDITDATGTSVLTNGSFTLQPPLDVRLSLGAPHTVSVGTVPTLARVTGGGAPYSYTLEWSDGEAGSGVLDSAGPLWFNASLLLPGNFTARLQVVDALGGHASINLTVNVRPSSSPPTGAPASPSPTPATAAGTSASLGSWVVGVGGLALAGLLFVIPRWRRRTVQRSRSGDTAAAMNVVRRLLRGTDGLERETLYFLADEEGIDASSAGVAVDRWTRAGRVQVDEGLDGTDLLQWVDPGSGTATDPTPTEGRA